MNTCRIGPWAIICLVVFLIMMLPVANSIATGVSLHSEPSEGRAQIKKAIQAKWDAAKGIPDLSPNIVHWTQEQWWMPPEEEMDRLRNEVRDRPDHPQRQQLERFEAHHAGRPTTIAQALLAAGPNRWRLCRTMADSIYSDVTVTDRRSWQLTNDQLEVAPAGHDDYVRYYNLPRAFWFELSFNIDGGFSVYRMLKDYRLGSVSVGNDGQWNAKVVMGEGPAETQHIIEFVGRWAESLPLVERSRVVQNPADTSAAGHEVRLKDYRYSEELGQWIAERVEWYGSDSRLYRVVRIDRVEPLPRKQFERAFAVPSATTIDVVRGELSFARVVEHGQHGAVVRGEEGVQTLRGTEHNPPRSLWRRGLGQAVAVMLAVGLIVIYMYRRIYSPA